MIQNPLDIVQLLAGDSKVRENPFPIYDMARSMGEVIPVMERFYLATSFFACDSVLRNHSFGKRADSIEQARPLIFDSKYPPSMLFQDPPNHTRLRRSVTTFFTPSKISGLEPLIRETTRSALSSMVKDGGGDIVSKVALEIPISVISAMLGVDRGERSNLAQEVAIVAASLDIGERVRQGDRQELIDAGSNLLSFFDELIQSDLEKTRLLTSLMEGDSPLDGKETAVMALLLFMAGFETTANLLSSMAYRLGTDDEVYSKVGGFNDLLPRAVDEFLRLDSPVQLDGRVVQSEVTIAGVELEVGSFILTLLGGANRDPSVFEDPNAFRLDRSNSSLISFGAGIHHCVGATLARREGAIFLEELLKLPTYEVVSAKAKSSLTLRGFESIEVKF
ncbi:MULTISPECIES: cytochrome P450 [Acidithrix]|uniref:Biotin biosynthesis cytochrome P450 n=1 Tax=Acidithrix ferrooxidans TaxID=1280514 RepID=A0A0D8HEX4_9ACTN|nr:MULTISPECIES: cytochrome P450 [Acidithrix]KJF16473.1 biotin biosynthesis cytochrome P450 [Acidithrix ferrooxidans]CAG4929058.1 unnamed protein product [Acidithrix sp. C25]